MINITPYSSPHKTLGDMSDAEYEKIERGEIIDLYYVPTHIFQGPSHLSEPVFNELRKQLPLAGYTIVETTKNIKEEYPPNFPEIIGKLEKISERFTLSPDTEFPPVVVLMENRDLLLWSAKEVSHNKYDEISLILARIRQSGKAYNVFLIEHVNSTKPEWRHLADLSLPHILEEPKYPPGTINDFSLLDKKKASLPVLRRKLLRLKKSPKENASP